MSRRSQRLTVERAVFAPPQTWSNDYRQGFWIYVDEGAVEERMKVGAE
jgi:hypothetical protein